jgi:enoyl-[acyl-carrier-protein] reductase (NADH)
MLEKRFSARDVYKEDLFKGKTILLTGGGSGIGRLIADSFVELGGDVIITSRDEEKLSRTKSEILKDWKKEITYYVCDISDDKSVKGMVASAFKEKGNIDILEEANIILDEDYANTTNEENNFTQKSKTIFEKAFGKRFGFMSKSSSIDKIKIVTFAIIIILLSYLLLATTTGKVTTIEDISVKGNIIKDICIKVNIIDDISVKDAKKLAIKKT